MFYVYLIGMMLIPYVINSVLQPKPWRPVLPPQPRNHEAEGAKAAFKFMIALIVFGLWVA